MKLKFSENQQNNNKIILLRILQVLKHFIILFNFTVLSLICNIQDRHCGMLDL